MATMEGRRYHVVDPKALGKGANGSVYKVRDTSTNELVVVKVINRHKCNSYVTSELLNHRQLHHPHVIGFRGVWVSNNSVNIVMELADSGTLLDFVNSSYVGKKMPENLARYFFQQLILAVDYCHKKGVANRDIKLENVLLRKVPQGLPMLKLCDWGYSKVTEVNAKTAVGTLHYMAPQPFENLVYSTQQNYNATAADIWSCGVCLFALLTSCYPFTYDMTKDQYMDHGKMLKRMKEGGWNRPEVTSQLSPQVMDLLARLLTPDEEQRITIAHIAQHAWFKINLDQAAFTNNDAWVQQPVPEGLQSAEEIKQLMGEALKNRWVARHSTTDCLASC